MIQDSLCSHLMERELLLCWLFWLEVLVEIVSQEDFFITFGCRYGLAVHMLNWNRTLDVGNWWLWFFHGGCAVIMVSNASHSVLVWSPLSPESLFVHIFLFFIPRAHTCLVLAFTQQNQIPFLFICLSYFSIREGSFMWWYWHTVLSAACRQPSSYPCFMFVGWWPP